MSTIGDVGAGYKLGRYELLAPLALGGMAAVWAARVKGPVRKIVAVKLIRAELSDDPDFEEMFLDEGALVSRLRHPNIAEILDLGEESGMPYQVMEWVDGEPLHLLMRESRASGGVPLLLTLRIARQVCAGLHAAHELRGDDGQLVGLVHRDVSPQNILVGYDGIVKVVDFGVAKATSNLQQTRVGQMKGKVPYMSPEQARGERVDRRSDVFALGIVLYQLITSKHPFMAENEPATLRKIGDRNPVEPPRKLVSSLPSEVADLVMKALEKDREQRFASMLEMMRALDRAAVPLAGTTAEDLPELMKRVLGPRGERRRATIRDAEARMGDSQPKEVERTRSSRPPRPSGRDEYIVATTPELESIVKAAAAAAEASKSTPPPPIRRAGAAPWNDRARSARRAQIAAFGGIGIALVITIIAVLMIARSSPNDRPALTGNSVRPVGTAFLRAARIAAAAARE